MTPAPGARFPLVNTLSNSGTERLAAQHELAAIVAKLQGELVPHGELLPGESLALRARMTPLDPLGRPRESREVRLRVLNERELAFEHPAPLADRRAWVLLESSRYGTVAAEIELSWCRYNEGGRYTSGGRFVQFLSQVDQLRELGLNRHSA
jgi:hypothetical protein